MRKRPGMFRIAQEEFYLDLGISVREFRDQWGDPASTNLKGCSNPQVTPRYLRLRSRFSFGLVEFAQESNDTRSME